MKSVQEIKQLRSASLGSVVDTTRTNNAVFGLLISTLELPLYSFWFYDL